MSKTTTLIDLEKILEFAERGLLKVSLTLEGKVDKFLGRAYKKDKIHFLINQKEKERKKQNKELAKHQDFQLKHNERVQKRGALEKQQQTTQRLQEIENNEQDQSQDAELDRE